MSPSSLEMAKRKTELIFWVFGSEDFLHLYAPLLG